MVASLKLSKHPTPHGRVAVYGAENLGDPSRPAVVMIHGAFRNALALASWADRLEDAADVVLVDLPGHDNSDLPDRLTVGVMAEAVLAGVAPVLAGRRALLVGESIGATVALAMGGAAQPGSVAAVAAFDPVLTTSKLWGLAPTIRKAISTMPDPAMIERLGRDAFGVVDGGLEERIYYPLVGALRVPAMICTGDVALAPPRALAEMPCALDAVDAFVLGAIYAGKAEAVRLSGCGHLMLRDAAPGCERLIRRMLATHFT